MSAHEQRQSIHNHVQNHTHNHVLNHNHYRDSQYIEKSRTSTRDSGNKGNDFYRIAVEQITDRAPTNTNRHKKGDHHA